MFTLEDILTDANSLLDLEASTPTGDELTLRTQLANRAVREASGLAQFSQLKQVYEVNTSTLATIPLPSNFRELQENPRILDSSGNWNEYVEIDAEQKYNYNSSDKYCYVLGNSQEGYVLYLNNIIANATLSVVFQRYPSGFATLTDKSELPDGDYITRKIEEYVLYARSDDRFPIAQGLANQSLKNMIGRSMKTSGGQVRMTKATFTNPLK